MTQASKGRGPTERSAPERVSTTPTGLSTAAGAATSVRAKNRKAYQRPSVAKQRSVYQATLVSSGGTSGTLTSGTP